MATKPDAEKGSLLRTLLTFLGTSTGLVLVCVLLNVTGVVRWKDLVELLHGKEAGAAATKEKAEGTPPPGKNDKSNTGDKQPDKPLTPVPPAPVVPPNTPPRLTAKPSVVSFSEGERTRLAEITVEDEDPANVKVTASVAPVGLIPAGGARVNGTGKTRFLEVTIDPDRWGDATVRLTGIDHSGLIAETTVKVSVPAPALSIRAIPDVSVAAGEPIAIIPVTVDDKARTPGKVTVTAISTDPLFAPEGLKLDPGGSKLQLEPRSGKHGTATVTLVARTDDGRETRRTFQVLVKLVPPYNATVVLSLPSGALDMDVKGLNKVLDAPALDKGTVVKVKKVEGKRSQIEWSEGGMVSSGWVDTTILNPVE